MARAPMPRNPSPCTWWAAHCVRCAIRHTLGRSTAETSKPVVTLDLPSNRVHLADLPGFASSQPSRDAMAHEGSGQPASKTPASKAKAAAGGRLLPDTPFSLHRLNGADIHLR